MGVNVCPHSADSGPASPFAKFGKTFSTWSAHYPGNRVGHVLLEEAGSCKGEELLVSRTHTHLQKDTSPTLLCHRGWAKGRGRGQPRVGAKITTLVSEVGLPHFVEKTTPFTPWVFVGRETHPSYLDSTHEFPFASQSDCMPALDSPGKDSSSKGMLELISKSLENLESKRYFQSPDLYIM